MKDFPTTRPQTAEGRLSVPVMVPAGAGVERLVMTYVEEA